MAKMSSRSPSVKPTCDELEKVELRLLQRERLSYYIAGVFTLVTLVSFAGACAFLVHVEQHSLAPLAGTLLTMLTGCGFSTQMVRFFQVARDYHADANRYRRYITQLGALELTSTKGSIDLRSEIFQFLQTINELSVPQPVQDRTGDEKRDAATIAKEASAKANSN